MLLKNTINVERSDATCAQGSTKTEPKVNHYVKFILHVLILVLWLNEHQLLVKIRRLCECFSLAVVLYLVVILASIESCQGI